MLKCHQTLFLVRGCGLGTRLRPISLLLVLPLLLFEVSHNTQQTFMLSDIYMSAHTNTLQAFYTHTRAHTHTHIHTHTHTHTVTHTHTYTHKVCMQPYTQASFQISKVQDGEWSLLSNTGPHMHNLMFRL